MFGLINMNGRLYDPKLRRFLSPDVENQAPNNSQNYNRYSYCLNNPVNFVDLSGNDYGDYYDDYDGDFSDQMDYDNLIEIDETSNNYADKDNNTGWDFFADVSGFIANIFDESARTTTNILKETDSEYKTIKGVGNVSAVLGVGALTVSVIIDWKNYKENKTWGNLGRMSIDIASGGLGYVWPGWGTLIGVGIGVANNMGAFDDFYDFLDADQKLYESTGNVIIPGANIDLSAYPNGKYILKIICNNKSKEWILIKQ